MFRSVRSQNEAIHTRTMYSSKSFEESTRCVSLFERLQGFAPRGF